MAGDEGGMKAVHSGDLHRLIEIALRESGESEKIEVDLRQALEDGDNATAIALARRLVGLSPDVRRIA